MKDSEINDIFWTNIELQLKHRRISLVDLARGADVDSDNLRSRYKIRGALRKDTECMIANYLGLEYHMLFVKPDDMSYVIRDNDLGRRTITLKHELNDIQYARLEGYLHCLYEEIEKEKEYVQLQEEFNNSVK